MYLLGGMFGCGRKTQKFDGTQWVDLAEIPFATASGSCGFLDGEVRVSSRKFHPAFTLFLCTTGMGSVRRNLCTGAATAHCWLHSTHARCR